MKLKDLLPEGLLPETTQDALALLRADHDKVEDLFASFDQVKYGRADTGKAKLVGEVCREALARRL